MSVAVSSFSISARIRLFRADKYISLSSRLRVSRIWRMATDILARQKTRTEVATG